MLLDRLGVLPRRRLREALRRSLTFAEGLLAVCVVLAIAAALDSHDVFLVAGGVLSAAMVQRLIGTLALVGALAALGLVYLLRFQPQLVRTRRQIVAFGACCLACVAAAKALLWLDGAVAAPYRSLVYLTPISAFTILFTVAYGQREAIAAGVILAIVCGLAVYIEPLAVGETGRPWVSGAPSALPPHAEPVAVVVVLMAGALIGPLACRRIRKRLKPIEVGILIGLAQAFLLLAFYLILGRLWPRWPRAWEPAWALANGLGVGILVTVLLPLVELVFNVATDIRLLELSDQDQPLLRSLVTLAPSTDNHSRRVARLAEAAAEAVGANSLLALVGSYYHDIGKMTKPQYYIENQTGHENPHDRLRPSMSSLIIISHVKDGVELALEARLPRAIVEIIEQHHGTSAVEFFYDRHLREARDSEPIDPSFFRYAGPRPATKEAAIIMLADSVEAASRTLDEPTPTRIEALVTRIIAAKLLDGQLEDCHLTLSEVRLIEQAMFRVLCAMYHARVEYPAARTERSGGGRRRRAP